MVKRVRKPIVSNEEKKYRNEMYPDINQIKNKNILCTSCNGSLKALISKGKPKTHPFMDTLLCEKCNTFFGDGEFSVDEDGSDKYCRWCGQGGTLYLCSTCTAGFCKRCIKRNLPRAALKEVENDDWQCFCCNIKPLYELRAHCWAANKFAAEIVKNEEGRKRKSRKPEESEESDDSEASGPKKKRKLDHSDNEDEQSSTPRARKTRKSQRKTSSENNKTTISGNKIQSISKAQSKIYKPVVDKISATIKDALSMTELFKKKANTCLTKKINLNYMKSVENVNEVWNKVDTLLHSVESISHQLRISVKEYLEQWNEDLKEIDLNSKKKNDNDEMELNGIEDEKKNLKKDILKSKTSEKDDDEDESIKKLSDHEESNDKQLESDSKKKDCSESDEEDEEKNGGKTEVKSPVSDKTKDLDEDNKGLDKDNKGLDEDNKGLDEDNKSLDKVNKNEEQELEEEADKSLIIDCDNEESSKNEKKSSMDEDIPTKESPSGIMVDK